MSGPSSLPRCVLSQLLGPPRLRPPISGQDSDQYGCLQENRSASCSRAPPNRHGARHAAKERGRPLTPDLWPLTRLSDGLSIPSGLAVVIVAWSSLDMLCLERGTAGPPASPGGPASSPVSTVAAEGVTGAATLKMNGGICVLCWRVVGARCHCVGVKLSLL